MVKKLMRSADRAAVVLSVVRVSLVGSRRSMDAVGTGAGCTDGMKDDPGLRVLPGDFCRMARDCRWPPKHSTAVASND